MEKDIIGELGGFALGEVFKELDLDADAIGNVGSQIGIRKSGAISRDNIYNGKFVDDVEEYDDELEAEVDKELKEEQRMQGYKAYSLGAQSEVKLARGEDDDFDDDSDGGGDMGGGEGRDAAGSPGNSLFGSAEASPAASATPAPEDILQLPPLQKETTDIRDIFPLFRPDGVLPFTDLLYRRRKQFRSSHGGVEVQVPDQNAVRPTKSTRDLLAAPVRHSKKPSRLQLLVGEFGEREHAETVEDNYNSDEELCKIFKRRRLDTFTMFDLDAWEDDTPVRADPALLQHYNTLLDAAWERGIVWEAGAPFDAFYTKVNLNMNDPNMLFETENEANKIRTNTNPMNLKKLAEKSLEKSMHRARLDAYNLSNDLEYEESSKTTKKKAIRQTFGFVEVQHARPAVKLMLPFYKTKLTKADERAFHRPPLKVTANIPITFSRPIAARRRVDRAGRKLHRGDIEAFRTTADISMRDTTPFVLWEFSEESPPLMSNYGMGSIIVNYYRRKREGDDYVPQLPLGQPLILEPNDESPFKTFGHVRPGETVPALYNNLVRAPLFAHTPNETDFLVVKVTIDGESKYYLREIKNIFVVGQTYPQLEVPSPHSRKITTLSKHRIQMVSYRLIAKNPRRRLKLARLSKFFPDQNDMQLRIRLKEFLNLGRKGPDQGFWLPRPDVDVTDESELYKLAPPESVCVAETMWVGLRHLRDLGYVNEDNDNVDGFNIGDNDDENSRLDIEQLLAPWITTRNFINATANKAMLKLYGEGDPTGRGEGFSFLRTSMKDIFLRDGEALETRLREMESRPKSAHRYNVQEQQEVYKEEIVRIWEAQQRALSSPVPAVVTRADEERYRRRQRELEKKSHASNGDVAQVKNRVLRIRRLVAGQWETQIVKDPAVIAGYVKEREKIEEDVADPTEIMPSNDAERNERMKKRLEEKLEKLKRNQERRLARKNGLAVSKQETTTRVCSNCGERGHMKTSRKLCKRWAEFNQPKEQSSTPVAPPTFGGGLALPAIGSTPKAASPPAVPTPPGGTNLKIRFS